MSTPTAPVNKVEINWVELNLDSILKISWLYQSEVFKNTSAENLQAKQIFMLDVNHFRGHLGTSPTLLLLLIFDWILQSHIRNIKH